MGYKQKNISEYQRQVAPEVYGKLDLDIQPERFRTELGANSMIKNNHRINALLNDKERVEFFRQLTLMGDPLADAFATTISDIGFRKAREMLDQAATEGVRSVKDAPETLVALMESVEKEPDWVDWGMIDSASENARMLTATAGEAIVRVAFMMTYVNGYQGLPMIITGALTSDSAANRMKETVSTFKMATLPGALKQGGLAYQSALKVRVMHAMVRTNLLKKKDVWDYDVYGVPIPQVDQMGAALGLSYIMSMYTLKKGIKPNKAMRASIEQSRYLAHLLGMHEQFLSNDPKQIVDTWQMVQATLRHKFDPRGKKLNQATLEAYRRHNDGWLDKLYHHLDVSSTRFMYNKVVGKRTAEEMGVGLSAFDAASFSALFLPIGIGYGAFSLLSRLPLTKPHVEKYCINETLRQLEKEGGAEYRTDERQYDYSS